MKNQMRILGAAFILSATFLGCKSGREAAGDKFLKAGDPGNAVMQYEEALKSGKPSRDFYANYTKANIQVLSMRAESDPSADFLDALKDTILALIKQYPNPENEAAFATALVNVGDMRLKMGTPQTEEGAFRFFETADALPQKPAEVSSKIAAGKSAWVAAKIKDVESDLAEVTKDNPAPAIVADYKLNQLSLVLGEKAPELKAIWSKVRQMNLSTYLMYDAEGLGIEGAIDARINKYPLLLGIVKLTPGTTVNIQAKVWNGSSGPINIDGSNFTLVDKEGKVYHTKSSLGAFKKKTMIGKGDESKTGGLSFAVPAGTQLDYLELNADESRSTRKYLP